MRSVHFVLVSSLGVIVNRTAYKIWIRELNLGDCLGSKENRREKSVYYRLFFHNFLHLKQAAVVEQNIEATVELSK